METPLFKVRISPQTERNLTHVFESGWIGQGSVVSNFEDHLSSFFGNVPVVTTNSCTSALHLAFNEIAKICKTVITTPLTCFATTATILQSGLKIKWADIDPKTLNISEGEIHRLYEPGDAICVVHFAGRPCPLPLDLKAPIVEDCAHAFGSVGVGTHSESYGCFSFQAVKTLTCGDGGCILPPSKKYKLMRKMSWYGMDRRLSRDQDVVEPGFKYHMNDITAAIGLANWNLAQESLTIQRDNGRYYSSELPDLSLPYSEESSNWLFPIIVDDRDKLIEKLKRFGIESSPAHYRNDKNSCVEQFQTDLPGMDFVEKKMTCIPNGWWVTHEKRERIVKLIREGW